MPYEFSVFINYSRHNRIPARSATFVRPWCWWKRWGGWGVSRFLKVDGEQGFGKPNTATSAYIINLYVWRDACQTPLIGSIIISVVRLFLLPHLISHHCGWFHIFENDVDKSVDPEKPQMLHGELGEGAAFLANIMLLHAKLTNFRFIEVV